MSVGPRIALESLPADARRAVEAALAGAEVSVTRDGAPVGTMTGRPLVLDGTVLPAPAAAVEEPPVRTDALVVATAMRLSASVRARLSEAFGEDTIVVDLLAAPETVDVVLAPPISPQLTGSLRLMFPGARLVVTEIDDPELGVSYGGPVGRMLDAGASAYIPPRPITEVAAAVRAHLAAGAGTAIEAGHAGGPRRGIDGAG